MLIDELTPTQQAILLASILGDGEITKCYPRSRRKNNSYREHFGEKQRFYREWKQKHLPDLFYIRQNNSVSRSLPLFTELYPYFYPSDQKDIPLSLFPRCRHPYFLMTLYLDDGSLIVSKRYNSKQQLIVTPTIALYLQSFSKSSLLSFCDWLNHQFKLRFQVANIPNGSGYYLRTTRFEDTMQFLNRLLPYPDDLIVFSYKLDWTSRFKIIQQEHPNHEVISTKTNRYFSSSEVEQLIALEAAGVSIQDIAKRLNRSVWSIYAKHSTIKRPRNESVT
ncbi:endonuclease [uncultured Exiguobacterium sp.]|uniref:endonuclease n=1 Tax=uncultured Exiguobacterium sp. TaxID=202669 RepID=UPI00374A5810